MELFVQIHVDGTVRFGLRRNPLIALGVAVELALILAIIYTPWGNALFGTAGIPPSAWLVPLPFAVGMLALEELRKVWARGRLRG